MADIFGPTKIKTVANPRSSPSILTITATGLTDTNIAVLDCSGSVGSDIQIDKVLDKTNPIKISRLGKSVHPIQVIGVAPSSGCESGLDTSTNLKGFIESVANDGVIGTLNFHGIAIKGPITDIKLSGFTEAEQPKILVVVITLMGTLI